jgi:hypothetical protein
MSAAAATEVVHREALGPPWWLWLWMVVLALSAGLVSLIAFEPLGVLLTTAVALAAGTALLVAWTGRVEVSGGELWAGPAHIDVRLLGRPECLDAERAAFVRGRGINAAAYHYIRGWVPEAVTVPVQDPADSTPYWYVSTRRPQDLAAAIEKAQRSAP